MGSKSKSSTKTTNQYYDQRQVNDAAGGVIGTGNTQDQSVTLTDSSRTTTNTTVNTTDGGAVKAAVAAQEKAIANAGAVASGAFGLAGRGVDGAYKSSAEALDFGRDVLSDVVGLARSVVDQAGTQAEAAGQIAAGAYGNAADSSSGDKTLKYAGIAAVALVGAGVVFGIFRK